MNVFQPSAVMNAASPISEIVCPVKSSRKSRCRSASSARGALCLPAVVATL